MLGTNISEFPSSNYRKLGVYKKIPQNKLSIVFIRFNEFNYDELKNILTEYGKNHFKTLFKIDIVNSSEFYIKNYNDFKRIFQSIKNKFIIILPSNEMNDLYLQIRRDLIQNDIPNQTILINTMENLGFSILNLIFLQMYIKVED